MSVGIDKSRRNLVVSLSQAACCLAVSACNRAESNPISRKIDLGEAIRLQEGENLFSLERLLILKNGAELKALSLVCPHQQCLVEKSDEGFHCPCHGARFDSQGAKIDGPVQRGLSWHTVEIDERGRVMVDLAREIGADKKLG